MCGRDGGTESTITSTSPARSAVIAAAAPRYGTCTISTPAWYLRSSAERCTEVPAPVRSEEHTSELQSLAYLVCRLLLEKKKKRKKRLPPSTRYQNCLRTAG